jgi:hypothetical protein
MSNLTLECFLEFTKEVDAQYNKLDAKPKPRIKFYGNGDVYMECYNTHRACYPNASNITFRTPWMTFTRIFKQQNLRLINA